MPPGGRGWGQGRRWAPRRAPRLGACSHAREGFERILFAQPLLHPQVPNSETPSLNEVSSPWALLGETVMTLGRSVGEKLDLLGPLCGRGVF